MRRAASLRPTLATLLLGTFLLPLPPREYESLGWVGPVALTAGAALIAASAFGYAWASGIDPSKESWILFVCLLCLGFLLVAGVPYTYAIHRGSVALFAPFLSVGLVCGVVLGPDRAGASLCVFAAAQASLCALQSMIGRGGVYTGDLFRPGGSLGDTTATGILLACCLPLSLGLALRGRSWLYGSLAAVVGTGLLLTWSRGPEIAALGGCLWVVWRRLDSERPGRALLLACLIALPVVASVSIRHAGPERWDRGVKSAASRWKQWRGGLEEFVHAPLGRGPGNVGFTFEDRRPDGAPMAYYSDDPKNGGVMLLDTFGVFGGVLGPLYAGCAARRLAVSHPLTAEMQATFLCLLLISVFDSPFLVVGRECTLGFLGLFSGWLIRGGTPYVR